MFYSKQTYNYRLYRRQVLILTYYVSQRHTAFHVMHVEKDNKALLLLLVH